MTVKAVNLAGWKQKGKKAAQVFRSRRMSRILSTEAGAEMRKISKEQFQSEGAAGASGRWPDLDPQYAVRKQQLVGAKTIMRFRSRLYRSLTSRANEADPRMGTTSSGFRMWYGTKIPIYPEVHHKGIGPQPERKIIDPSQRQMTRMARRLEKATRRELKGLPFVDKVQGRGARITRGGIDLTTLLQQSIAQERAG